MKDILNNWMKDNQVRITSPVIGAFISAWILFNWDKFLLLFWGEGKIAERLDTFKETANFSNLQFWFWPLILALIYVFGLPYLNVLTQKLKRHSDLLRHNEVIGTDIEKEKKLGELNEQRYKSNPENDYIGRKIKADIEKIEADSKTANAEAETRVVEAEKEKDVAAKIKLETEQAKLDLEKNKRVEEREKQAHERAKVLHENMVASARFPTLYEYIQRLSYNLKEDDIVLSLDAITRALAVAFGFQSSNDIVSDPDFTLKNIKELSFVAYDPEVLLDELKDILDDEGTKVISESDLFDYIIQLFEEIDHCKFISTDSISDEALGYFEENQFDITQLDELSGPMAETNAYFDEVDDPQVISVSFEQQLQQWQVKMTCLVSGTNHEDKMFYGDTINVSLTVAYPIVLGSNGVGMPEFRDISGSVYHPE